jgi:hypothetical protein
VDVKKTIDNVNELLARVTALTRSEVLVGVPEEKGARKEGVVTNAMLARVHEFGSPAHNIPARPFINPGIKKARPQIVSIMKKGAQDALEAKDVAASLLVLEKVGMAARNSVVREISNPAPPYAPLAAATIRGRLRRTQGGRRKLREIKEGGQAAGMTMRQALTAYGSSSWDTGGAGLNVRPLIDTGQLRASITYVVRKAES